jgi:hypothetical protein
MTYPGPVIFRYISAVPDIRSEAQAGVIARPRPLTTA